MLLGASPSLTAFYRMGNSTSQPGKYHRQAPAGFISEYVLCLVNQSCLTLCDPMACSPPGSSVHGTLQARILEWVVIPFSRGSSWPRKKTQVSCIAGSHQGNLLIYPATPGWSCLITNKSLTSLVLTSGEIKNSSGWLSLLAWPKFYLTCIRPKPSELHITCQI